MDTTIRNLDEDTYRRFKAWAVRHGKTVGESMTDAMAAHLRRHGEPRKPLNIWEIPSVPGGRGARTASRDVDRIVYGTE